MTVGEDGSLELAQQQLHQGYIVDNKAYVVADGGVQAFFDNTGNI